MASVLEYVQETTIVTCGTFHDLVARHASPHDTNDLSGLAFIDLTTGIRHTKFHRDIEFSREQPCTAAQISKCLRDHVEGRYQRLITGYKRYNFFAAAGKDGSPVVAVVYQSGSAEWRKLAWDPSHDELEIPKGSRLFRIRATR